MKLPNLSIEQDRVQTVILDCAATTDLIHSLSHEAGIPVIDGVVAGVKTREGLIGARISIRKVGAYARLLNK